MKVSARFPLILTFSRQGRRDFTNTPSVESTRTRADVTWNKPTA